MLFIWILVAAAALQEADPPRGKWPRNARPETLRLRSNAFLPLDEDGPAARLFSSSSGTPRPARRSRSAASTPDFPATLRTRSLPLHSAYHTQWTLKAIRFIPRKSRTFGLWVHCKS